jgi:hypothetical protein
MFERKIPARQFKNAVVDAYDESVQPHGDRVVPDKAETTHIERV